MVHRLALVAAVLVLCASQTNTLQTDGGVPVFPAAASVDLSASADITLEEANATRCPHTGRADAGCQSSAAAEQLRVAGAAPAAAVKSAQQSRRSRASQHGQLIQDLRDENDWKNGLALWVFPDSWVAAMPRVVRSWLRCYLMCMLLYVGTGSAWAYYIYGVFRQQLFKGQHTPAASDMLEQIKVSCLSIPIYSMLPAVQEWVIEKGWTRAYARVSDVGLGWHVAYFVAFMTSVEFGVYWMHRLLHDIRLGYRTLHYIHHKYNKEHTLSPFAGLAFHPLDGILQAIPYCWTLFFIPAHFLTFEMLLFLTGIWTTNIHDCVDGKVEPIMGAGYHTIHHTIYKHNYGHYFVYMDKLFGSLVTPAEYEAAIAKPGSSLKAA